MVWRGLALILEAGDAHWVIPQFSARTIAGGFHFSLAIIVQASSWSGVNYSVCRTCDWWTMHQPKDAMCIVKFYCRLATAASPTSCRFECWLEDGPDCARHLSASLVLCITPSIQSTRCEDVNFNQLMQLYEHEYICTVLLFLENLRGHIARYCSSRPLTEANWDLNHCAVSIFLRL